MSSAQHPKDRQLDPGRGKKFVGESATVGSGPLGLVATTGLADLFFQQRKGSLLLFQIKTSPQVRGRCLPTDSRTGLAQTSGLACPCRRNCALAPASVRIEFGRKAAQTLARGCPHSRGANAKATPMLTRAWAPLVQPSRRPRQISPRARDVFQAQAAGIGDRRVRRHSLSKL